MKVAIAVWKDRISPVFDVSRKVLIIDIENDSVIEEAFEIFEKDSPIYKVTRLVELKVEALICGAISNTLLDLISLHEIKTISFTCGKVEDVIKVFLQNVLPDREFMMPGCRGFRKQTRNRK